MRIERKRSSHVPYLTHRELLALRAEALRRLPYQRKWRAVAGLQDDPGHFDLIDDATGLPRRIRSREDLETHLPERSSRSLSPSA